MTTQQRAKTGSAMSTKQLARTVDAGCKVTFWFTPAGEASAISGYLCGMDDYHWMVVTPEGTKHLIHKAGPPVIDISDDPTYSSEPNHEELERVVAPFRRNIQETILGRAPSVPRAVAG